MVSVTKDSQMQITSISGWPQFEDLRVGKVRLDTVLAIRFPHWPPSLEKFFFFCVTSCFDRKGTVPSFRLTSGKRFRRVPVPLSSFHTKNRSFKKGLATSSGWREFQFGSLLAFSCVKISALAFWVILHSFSAITLT